jgi:arylsulfatase
MTDNGHSIGSLYNAGMRSNKGSPYQGGTRVPAFFRWKGVLPEGTDCDALTAHIDFFPTFCELAGVDVPAGIDLDGRSLVPLLKDAKAPWEDRYVFVHKGRWPRGKAQEAKFADCAIRNSRFRFVNNRELYDLENDPGEKTNVIDDHPEVVANMRAAYDQWWSEVLPAMVNEDAVGPKINPFKALYYEQFGGEPSPALLRRMDPMQVESPPSGGKKRKKAN